MTVHYGCGTEVQAIIRRTINPVEPDKVVLQPLEPLMLQRKFPCRVRVTEIGKPTFLETRFVEMDLPYGSTRPAVMRALQRRLGFLRSQPKQQRQVLDVTLDPTGYDELALEWGTVLIAAKGGVV